MKMCRECGYVNSHSPNCPEAEECNERAEEGAPICTYCDEPIWHSRKWTPDCLPDDIPHNWAGSDELSFHPSCFEEFISEARQELCSKHACG